MTAIVCNLACEPPKENKKKNRKEETVATLNLRKASNEQQNWFITRTGCIVCGGTALVLAYIIASRALDTGSLGQYGLTILLLIVGINRLIRASHK